MSWRSALPDLLVDHAFRTQADIVRALSERGEAVDTSTVSRELKNLGVTKVAGVYRLPPPPSVPVRVLRMAITHGGGMAVLHTDAACAPLLANAIDDRGVDGVLGTIAGDDTVFVALSNPRAIDALRALTRPETDTLEMP